MSLHMATRKFASGSVMTDFRQTRHQQGTKNTVTHTCHKCTFSTLLSACVSKSCVNISKCAHVDLKIVSCTLVMQDVLEFQSYEGHESQALIPGYIHQGTSAELDKFISPRHKSFSALVTLTLGLGLKLRLQ